MTDDLLSYAVLLVLLLLAAYVCRLAFRSRETELRQALRRSETAHMDAERSLQSAARLHAYERHRFEEEAANETKFRAAKSAFARLFHPDAYGGTAGEREIRTEMFKRYWSELERIERGV